MRISLKVETGEREVRLDWRRDLGEYHILDGETEWEHVYEQWQLLDPDNVATLNDWLQSRLPEIRAMITGEGMMEVKRVEPPRGMG